MRMMGELPLHIGGEMNCSDQIQIKGDRSDMGSTCTYSGHTELGQPHYSELGCHMSFL